MSATVRLHGNGDPQAFLIHGGPGAQGTLHGLAASLAFPCAEILQRRAGEVPLTVDLHVADMTHLIAAPTTLVGHSWGAMLSLSFGAVHPEKCRQLILVGCGTYSATSRAEYERLMADRTDLNRKAELKSAIENAKTMEERSKAFADYGSYATNLQSYEPVSDPYPDPEPSYDVSGHGETWRDALRLQSEGVEPARFAKVSCPVTLIHGDHDPHVGKLVLADLVQYVPQIQYIEFAQCGHEPWLESHARTEFIQRLNRLASAH